MFRPNRLCPVINGITTHLIVTGGPQERISFPQHLLGFAPILAGPIIMGCHDDCLDDGQGIDYFCGLRFTGETTSKRITFIHIPLHASNTHKHSHHNISISSVLLRWKQIGPFARRHHHCFFACDNTELDANWNVFTFDMGHLSRCEETGEWDNGMRVGGCWRRIGNRDEELSNYSRTWQWARFYMSNTVTVVLR